MRRFVALSARIALLVVWLFTSLVNRAFHGSWILPLLGILLLPIATLTCVLVYSIAGSVTGWGWLWVALAVLLDLAAKRARGRRGKAQDDKVAVPPKQWVGAIGARLFGGKAQDGKVAIPPGFEMDFRRAGQLEIQGQRDPRAMVQLIQLLEQMVGRLQPDEAPFFYATIQASMGVAYYVLLTGDRASNLTKAIACFQQALRFWTSETALRDYAMVQNSLGAVYADLPTGDRASNLDQAMTCFQQALRFYTPKAAPRDYAQTQNNLGNVYQELPTGDRASNLAKAIACYQQALRFYAPKTTPQDYAMVQHNLGNAYRELPTGDQASNLAQAIACFQQALRFRAPQDAPLEYAMVQSDLGAAYANLPTGDRASDLTKAIACFQQALHFFTPDGTPQNYAMVQNSLGAAYADLPTRDRASNLAQAIACFQQALRFFTPDGTPRNYAMVQHNLGNAYRELPTGDQASNLAQAIACFQQALRFWTPETAPQDYAMVQNSLGSAYRNLPTGNRASNLAQAIACYQEALRFFTPEAEPHDCRGTTLNLANLYFAQGSWNEALRACRVAMDIGEQLYRGGLSTMSKTAEVSKSAALYPHAAFAAVRCGEPTEALFILEQGKTRLLTEALRLRVRRPPHVPDAIWSAFEQAGATVRAVQAEQPYTTTERHDSVQAYEMRVQAGRAANAVLNAAIADVRAYAPQFLAVLDRSTLEVQLPDTQTAFIAFCITEQGSMGFIVSRHNKEQVQVIEVPSFTQADLDHLFAEWDAEGHLTGGWLGAYDCYLTDRTTFEAWQDTITRVLAELGERLLAPIVSALSADIEHIIFLPSGALFQFPLHAIPLAGADSELICNRYQVCYAPSIEVLTDTRAKARQEVTPELYAVINPEDDPRLLFTSIEGSTVAQLFAQSTVDVGQGGTKARVLAGMQGRAYVHFSCHGSYQWNDPPASGLHLADARLTLADLQQGVVDLSTVRVVTLSACETGITDILRGNAGEYVGIPAGFLLAGAACVVSSLWAVDDLSTALLMEKFYRNHLINKMAFSAALQEAQVWLRELSIGEVAAYAAQWYRQSTQKEEEKKKLLGFTLHYRHLAEKNPTLRPFAHPHYWAAFTVNGI